MAHVSGKIEILGIMNGEIYFKYHQAKNRENLGMMFKRRVDEKAGWLDDFTERRKTSKSYPTHEIFLNDLKELA